MALRNQAQPPLGDPIAQTTRPEYRAKRQPDPKEGFITTVWADFISALVALQEKFSGRVANVELTEQSTDIGATDMTGGALTAGLYRVSYYLPITTSEGLTEVALTIDWQDGGVTRTFNGAGVDGSSTANFDTNAFLIRVDAGAPVRYSTIITLGGFFPPTHALYITLEEVKA